MRSLVLETIVAVTNFPSTRKVPAGVDANWSGSCPP